MSRFRAFASRFAAAPLALAVLGLANFPAYASQTTARVALPQIERAMPAGAADAGDLPSSQPIPSMVIELKRSAAQQADLDAFLLSVTRSGSSDFHH